MMRCAGLSRNVERYRTNGHGLFAVVLKSTAKLSAIADWCSRTVEGESLLEVGYHLRRDHWGHGYATEAARACMTYAFGPLRVEKIVSLIRAENLPSRHVAERNGMKVERQVMFHGLPHLMYAMTREDYGQA